MIKFSLYKFVLFCVRLWGKGQKAVARKTDQICHTHSTTIYAALHTDQDRNRWRAITRRMNLNRDHEPQN